MYDAYEKRASLERCMDLLEQMQDEIAGMGFKGLEYSMRDLMAEIWDENNDLSDEIMEANREQEEEQQREWERSR